MELVAVMGLLTMVLGFVYAGVASLRNAVEGTDRRLQNLDEGRILMATVSKDLRTAIRPAPGVSPFVVADANHMELYGNLNPTPAPRLIELSISANDELVEETTAAMPAAVAPYDYTDYDADDTEVRLVGRYVNNDAADPLFIYYDSDGNELGPTPLTAGQRLAVNSIGISFTVKKESGFAPNPTVIRNRVRLPNVNYQEVQ
ncbi:MAG: hypothetical protein M5U31_11570 [Acidimicrobiia bacterium]|nr:hypothetical protein [Acidimicrobiia bacterium]